VVDDAGCRAKCGASLSIMAGAHQVACGASPCPPRRRALLLCQRATCQGGNQLQVCVMVPQLGVAKFQQAGMVQLPLGRAHGWCASVPTQRLRKCGSPCSGPQVDGPRQLSLQTLPMAITSVTMSMWRSIIEHEGVGCFVKCEASLSIMAGAARVACGGLPVPTRGACAPAWSACDVPACQPVAG
jgi:hypothetical protein